MTTPTTPDETLTCSARGCRAPAAFQLRWHNPRLHAPDRRQDLAACRSTAAPSVTSEARGFLREVVPLP
ncbi:hypothetical protein V2I01_00610 [Micromonospora sp. BRA006-A]|nr:hypothetical protein [Micromonospora sp. BRA006-A]